MRKSILAACMAMTLSVAAYGESERTLFTYENRVPEKGQVEIGVLGVYREVPDEDAVRVMSRDEYLVGPYLRYGLSERLSVSAAFPYKYIDPKYGDAEQGPGDVVLEAVLVAFQDIFGYPFVIPHVSLFLPTGDEDKGLGEGETQTRVGVSIGTTIYDVLHFIVDGSYTIRRDETNVKELGASIVWDLDKRFSVQAEFQVSNDKFPGDDNNPVYYLGGATYRPSEALQITVYGGGAQHAETDVYGGAKVSYSF